MSTLNLPVADPCEPLFALAIDVKTCELIDPDIEGLSALERKVTLHTLTFVWSLLLMFHRPELRTLPMSILVLEN